MIAYRDDANLVKKVEWQLTELVAYVYNCGSSEFIRSCFVGRFTARRTRARGGAVWQLVGLITRRSQVQILPPQPNMNFEIVL